MSDEHVVDLLPGYVLDALNEEDNLTVIRHLPRCVSCRNELSSYEKTINHLAMAAPLHTPPPDLKAKVVLKVTRESMRHFESTGSKSSKSNFRDVVRSIYTRPFGWVVSGLILLVVLFLGVNNLLLWQRVNDLQARLPSRDLRVVQLEGTLNAPQAVGYLMVFKNEAYGTLAVENAPILQPDQQYQIWLIQNGQRTSGGVFSVDENGYGTLGISVTQPLENYQSFGITIEPVGGSVAPTGQRVMQGIAY